MKDKLEIRRSVKKRKPAYLRQQYGYFAKLSRSKSWRKPTGIHSKIRERRKGHRCMPEVGYGSPRVVRGLTREGFVEVLVSNFADLERIDVKKEVAVLSSGLGKRKKLEILKKAKDKKLKIANVKDIDAAISIFEKKAKKKEADKKTDKKKADVKKADAEKVEDKKVQKKTVDKEASDEKTSGGKKE